MQFIFNGQRNIFKEGELHENSVIRNFQITAADCKSYEKQIDKMVGQAQRRCPYNDLTPEEIAIVEGKKC